MGVATPPLYSGRRPSQLTSSKRCVKPSSCRLHGGAQATVGGLLTGKQAERPGIHGSAADPGQYGARESGPQSRSEDMYTRGFQQPASAWRAGTMPTMPRMAQPLYTAGPMPTDLGAGARDALCGASERRHTGVQLRQLPCPRHCRRILNSFSSRSFLQASILNHFLKSGHPERLPAGYLATSLSRD